MNATANITTAECMAWVSYAFWTLACAWPVFTVSFTVHIFASAVYGLMAWRWRSPLTAGAAGACLGSYALRTGVADHGAIVALLGMMVSVVAALLVFAWAYRGLVDEDGQVDAREVCLHLALTTGIAAVWSLPFADVIAWALGR